MISGVSAGLADAVAGIRDGSTVMIGGSGRAGQPVELNDALTEQGATDLTIVINNAGNGDAGIPAPIGAGRVRKAVCSLPRQVGSHIVDAKCRAGEIERELVPQGNLAERIRAAGAGSGGFSAPTGVGTLVAEGKEARTIDGRECPLELPLRADVALISAVDPEVVVTPGIVVDRVVAVGERSWLRGPVREHGEGGVTGIERETSAARIARDISEGAVVNLGIGAPMLIANDLLDEFEIMLGEDATLLATRHFSPENGAGRAEIDGSRGGNTP